MSMNEDAGSMAAQSLVKPLIVAGLAAAGSQLLLPAGYVPVRMLGKDVPVYAAAGIAAGVGSFGADILSQYILPNIDQSQKLAYTEGKLLSPLITAAATSAAFWVMNPATLSDAAGSIALLGGLSEISGMYAWESVIGPYLNRVDV